MPYGISKDAEEEVPGPSIARVVSVDGPLFPASLFVFGCDAPVVAPETLLVDDSAANCEAARSLGLHAHQFHSAESLSNELRQHGLI